MSETYRYLPFEIDGMKYAVELDYAAYIISATDQYPRCTPPKRNACVTQVLRIGQALVSVVELTALGKDGVLSPEKAQRPLILTLKQAHGLVGLLVDRVLPPLEFDTLNLQNDRVNQRTFLLHEGENFLLFDVPAFYGAFEASERET